MSFTVAIVGPLHLFGVEGSLVHFVAWHFIVFPELMYHILF